MGYDLKMRVWRGDADGGALGDYTVHVEEGEVVLDAIHRLQATQVGDLAVTVKLVRVSLLALVVIAVAVGAVFFGELASWQRSQAWKTLCGFERISFG